MKKFKKGDILVGRNMSWVVVVVFVSECEVKDMITGSRHIMATSDFRRATSADIVKWLSQNLYHDMRLNKQEEQHEELKNFMKNL